MRTLRDEALRIGRAHQHYLPSYDMFMGEYGSYWVAEGVLKTVRQANGRLAVELWDGMGHRVAIIGRVSDRVKLILPPEEKGVQADVEAQIVAICAERDRYERALREIDEATRAVFKQSLANAEAEWVAGKAAGLRVAARIAKGALDE